MVLRPSKRLAALDYLRGFFIVIIIIDHLWRWPSIYEVITGKAALWVTAAEGFVIISGLLVGYIRGYKNRDLPMKEVCIKLWKRAALLYIWLIIMTILYTSLTWLVGVKGSLAPIEVPQGDWGTLIWSTVTLLNAHTWIHFLYIYAMLLAVTPLVVWLLRARKLWAVAAFTIAGYIIGRLANIEWMQWMPVFFIPAIAGFYLPTIQHRWGAMSLRRQHITAISIVSVTALTIFASYVYTFIIPDHAVAQTLNQAMTKETAFNAWRIPMALLWFIGFVVLFEYTQKFIGRWLGWLLLPFGMYSLTAYIIHGSVLFIIALLFADSTNIWYNSLVGTGAILATWLLLKLPYTHKIIPR